MRLAVFFILAIIPEKAVFNEEHARIGADIEP